MNISSNTVLKIKDVIKNVLSTNPLFNETNLRAYYFTVAVCSFGSVVIGQR